MHPRLQFSCFRYYCFHFCCHSCYFCCYFYRSCCCCSCYLFRERTYSFQPCLILPYLSSSVKWVDDCVFMANCAKTWTPPVALGHFRVTLCLCSKTSLCGKLFIGKLVWWFTWKWTCRWNIFPYEWRQTWPIELSTWTLWMNSSPPSSLACSRWGTLERISSITCECDCAPCVVIGRRLCAINWCPNRLTVDRYKRWNKIERPSVRTVIKNPLIRLPTNQTKKSSLINGEDVLKGSLNKKNDWIFVLE